MCVCVCVRVCVCACARARKIVMSGIRYGAYSGNGAYSGSQVWSIFNIIQLRVFFYFVN